MNISRTMAILALGGCWACAAFGEVDCGNTESAGFGLRANGLKLAGNTGPVSIIVNGSKFDSQTDFTLTDGNGVPYPAVKAVPLNESRALVTFDLTGAAPGLADIAAAAADGTTDVLEDALDVQDGLEGQLYVNLEWPGEVVTGAPAPVQVVYGNTGHADIPVPLLHLDVPGASYLGREPEGNSMGEKALILGVPDSPVATTLRPGEEVRVPLYVQMDEAGDRYAHVVALDPNEPELASMTFDDTAIIAANPGDPFVADGLAAIRQEYGDNLQSYYTTEMSHLEEIADAGPNAYDSVQNIDGRWHLEPSLTSPNGPELTLGRAPDPTTPPVPLPDPPPPSGDGVQETHAIIIGINEYATDVDLNGCVRDASFVYNHFKYEMRLPDGNIQYFTVDRQTDSFTEQNMLDAIRNSGADGDDNLVIFYAGHGSYLTDDSKPDGVTGVLVMSDASLYEDYGYVRADELSAAITDKGAGQTYVIMDACHSEYMVRDMNSEHTAMIGTAGLDEKAAEGYWPLNEEETEGFSSGAFTPFFVQLLREGTPMDEAFARARDYVSRSGFKQTAAFNPDHVDVNKPFGEVDPTYVNEGTAYLDTYLGLFTTRMEDMDETAAILENLDMLPPEKVEEFMAEVTEEVGSLHAPGGPYYSNGLFDRALAEKIKEWQAGQSQQFVSATRSFHVVAAPAASPPAAFVPGGFAASRHAFLFYVSDNSNGRILLVNPLAYKKEAWLPILSGLDQPGDLDLDPDGRFLCYTRGGEVHRLYLGLSIRVFDRLGAPLAGARAVLQTALGTHNAIVDTEGYAHFPGLLEPRLLDYDIFIDISYQGAQQTFSGELNSTDHTVLRLDFTADPASITPAVNSTTPFPRPDREGMAGPGDGDPFHPPAEVPVMVAPGETTYLPEIPVFTSDDPPQYAPEQSYANPPTVSVATPASGLTSTNGKQTVFGTVNSGNVTSVNVVVNGATNSVEIPFLERDFCLEVTLPSGMNRIKVQSLQDGAPAGAPATADVEVDPAFDGSTGALAGRVVNQYQRGAASVAVTEAYSGAATTTDANGYYQFSGLPAGRAAIQVEP